jgi:biotin carboxyl carrier protein
MKMENVIKAAGDGVVKKINVAEKTAVEKGAVLIEFE